MKFRIFSILLATLIISLSIPSPVFAYYPKVIPYAKSGTCSFSNVNLANMHPDNCGLVIYGVPEKLRKIDALEEVTVSARLDSVDNPANQMYVGQEKTFTCKIEVGVPALGEDFVRNDTIGLHPTVDTFGIDGWGTMTYTWKFKEDITSWKVRLTSQDIGGGQSDRGQIKLDEIVYNLPNYSNELQADEYNVEYLITEGFTDVFLHWESSGAVQVVNPNSPVTSILLSGETGLAELKAVYEIPIADPILFVSKTSLNFSATESHKSFGIGNIGGGTLTWQISTNQPWLIVDPMSDSTAMEVDNVVVNVDRSKISNYPSHGTISISSNGEIKYVQVTVEGESDSSGSLAVTMSRSGGLSGSELNSLELWKNGSFTGTRIDPSGTSYTFSNLGAATYRVDAYINDMYAGSTGDVSISDQSLSRTITATTAATLTVTVHYKDGTTPYPGAQVEVYSHELDKNPGSAQRWASGSTNSGGQVSFNLQPSRSAGEYYILRVTNDGTTLKNVTLSTGGSSKSITTSTAGTRGSLTVKVSRAGGLSGAELSSLELLKLESLKGYWVDPTGTNHTFPNLESGTYKVDAYINDMYAGTTGDVAISGQSLTVTINATNVAKLSVTVYKHDGTTPYPNAQVEVYSHELIEHPNLAKRWDIGETNSNGEVSFYLQPTISFGEYYVLRVANDGTMVKDVFLSPNGSSKSIKTIKGGTKIQTSLILDLPPKNSGKTIFFSGRLLRDDIRKGIGGKTVLIGEPELWGDQIVSKTQTLADGSFRFSLVSIGTDDSDWRVIVKFDGNSEYEGCRFPQTDYYILKTDPSVEYFDFSVFSLPNSVIVTQGATAEFYFLVKSEYQTKIPINMPKASIRLEGLDRSLYTFEQEQVQLLTYIPASFRTYYGNVFRLKVDTTKLESGDHQFSVEVTSAGVLHILEVHLTVVQESISGARYVLYDTLSKSIDPEYWVNLAGIEMVYNAAVNPYQYTLEKIRQSIITGLLPQPVGIAVDITSSLLEIYSIITDVILPLSRGLSDASVAEILHMSSSQQPETDVVYIVNELHTIPGLINGEKWEEAKSHLRLTIDAIKTWEQKLSGFADSKAKQNALSILNAVQSALDSELDAISETQISKPEITPQDTTSSSPTLPGETKPLQVDISGDEKVDYKDLAIIGSTYGTSTGDKEFRFDADLNGDGVIDYKDLAILGANYGK